MKLETSNNLKQKIRRKQEFKDTKRAQILSLGTFLFLYEFLHLTEIKASVYQGFQGDRHKSVQQ